MKDLAAASQESMEEGELAPDEGEVSAFHARKAQKTSLQVPETCSFPQHCAFSTKWCCCCKAWSWSLLLISHTMLQGQRLLVPPPPDQPRPGPAAQARKPKRQKQQPYKVTSQALLAAQQAAAKAVQVSKKPIVLGS